MKRLFLLLFIALLTYSTTYSQHVKVRYGITAGLNLSTGLLPEMEKGDDIDSMLAGRVKEQGKPQLADFVNLYKGGVFIKVESDLGSAKFNINYTKTKIHQDLKHLELNTESLEILLDYIDFDFTYNVNLFENFYLSAGYIPSLLLNNNHEDLSINDFDQRLLGGIGFEIFNGTTIDFDAIVGLNEIINGSFIKNIMIPITVNIPLNGSGNDKKENGRKKKRKRRHID